MQQLPWKVRIHCAWAYGKPEGQPSEFELTELPDLPHEVLAALLRTGARLRVKGAYGYLNGPATLDPAERTVTWHVELYI